MQKDPDTMQKTIQKDAKTIQKVELSQVCPKLSQVCPKLSQAQLTKSSIALIALSESLSLPISALMEKAGEANRSRFRTNILSPLIELRLVEPTQKDSPQSPKQEYTLTDKGKEFIESWEQVPDS